MQNAFQIYTHRKLAELARWHQLQPCPLIESGNGTEYKNYLNDTVFTVYHGRLDEKNSGRIEVAVGIENIAAELSCSREIVEKWFLRTQQLVHPAESKSPQRWPRFSIWSLEEVELFCRSFDLLFKTSENPRSPDNKSRPHIPPIDERIMQQILSRRGQAKFRTLLLEAYGGCCAISGCGDIEVLEAAHITAHSETQDYRPSNGLLMRADLHTLFDLHLISIDPGTAQLVVSRQLGTTYQIMNGCKVNLPANPALQPDASALMRHFKLWQAREQE